MFYIGVNQAVHPDDKSLSGNNIFAIICVYLFVVFYSFGWGPIPFILSSECSPNHGTFIPAGFLELHNTNISTVRSLVMAAALMTQWLFNFVIAKITPIMLDDIGYGTFLLFGACCIIMLFYAILCVPETKGVPLESVNLLFDGNIIAGATKDTIPRYSRAKKLQNHHLGSDDDGWVDSAKSVDDGNEEPGKSANVRHVEGA